jgi:arginyl-tRNA synthetase
MDFKDSIAKLIAKETGQKVNEIVSKLEVPPKGMGDFAFPSFILAKEQKKAPNAISNDLAAKISADFIEKVEAKGPYVNFFLSKSSLSESVLKSIFDGKFIKKTEKGSVMLEYSGPNTNKPLHVGHLRNSSLGMAFSNLLEVVGLKVIRANIINDRGVHIMKSMLAYQKFGEGKTPKSEGKKSDHFVGDMYVLYAQKVAKNPELEEEAKAMLAKWEAGDKEIIALWKKMNKWAIDGMKETYDLFGSEFEEWFYESENFKLKAGHKIIEEGLAKGVFQKEDNGAIAAVLEPEIKNKILLRGDGTALYATNDLGVTQNRFDNFKLDKCIWVVASEQDFYFKQLFAIFEKLGRKWADKCQHLSYGMVNLTSGKMKSREGTVVDADDLIEEIKQLALAEIEKRYENLSEKEKNKRALAISLGAIKFFLLKNDAKKEILFDPKASLAFEGETGPYLQYAYARANSILRKAKAEKKKYKQKNFDLLKENKEKELIIELQKFSDAVAKSYEQLSLHPIAHSLLSIAEKFNSFYHEVNVLKSDSQELLNARLSLVEATMIVMKKGLSILDIVAIEEM